MTNGILTQKGLRIHIAVGLGVCGLLLVLLWLQTQSVAVIINAFGGLVMALVVGRWLEQYQQKEQQADLEAEGVENT